jgi:hypothetical protein
MDMQSGIPSTEIKPQCQRVSDHRRARSGAGHLLSTTMKWLAVVWALAGCSYQLLVNPANRPLPPDIYEAPTDALPIQIINAQDDRQQVLIHPGVIRYYGVMHDWTQIAADLLHEELSRRGIEIVPDASKKIMLRVLNAQLFTSSNSSTGLAYVRLNLEVQDSHASSIIFEGSHSDSDVNTAAGAAITSAVAAFLRDPVLVNLITQ